MLRLTRSPWMKVTVLVGEMLCTSSSLTQPGFSPFSSAMKYADTNPGCSDYNGTGTRYCNVINLFCRSIISIWSPKFFAFRRNVILFCSYPVGPSRTLSELIILILHLQKKFRYCNGYEESAISWLASYGSPLKVLTNEKRGGLRVISFDRSPFKLFSRKFSKESVQAPSCERHKTTQRTLFLLFANNYWFPITLLCLAAADFSHHTLNWNNGIVLLPRYLKWREKLGLHNKSFQITLTIHATFGVSAKDQ